jgi:rubrerythrin
MAEFLEVAMPAALQCQSCQRLVEEAEEFVCCAGATLEWRCMACHKMSEGFAFPYGQCPGCGGQLGLSEIRGEVAATPAAAIREALEIELGGMAFYQQAAKQTREPAAKALFEQLVAMEVAHTQTLARRYHVRLPDDMAMTPERAALYAGNAIGRFESGASLMQLAVELERKAAAYFAVQGAKFAEGSPERALYREHEEEEREHVELLSREYARLRAEELGLR